MESLLGNTLGAQEPVMDVFTKQQRIAALGKRFPERSFTSLHHYLDAEWLTVAYRTLNAKSAPGVDGVTVQEYGQNLRSNLEALLKRVHKGQYRAACVKRGWVPKGRILRPRLNN